MPFTQIYYLKLNKLPNEIIEDISAYLSFADKLNFVCASKKLHKIISESTLYSNLVFNDKLNFDQAAEIHNEKTIGRQVRSLFISNIKLHA